MGLNLLKGKVMIKVDNWEVHKDNSPLGWQIVVAASHA